MQKMVVLGTGGTIAGTSAQAGDNIGYAAAQVGVAQLLAAVPGLEASAGGPLVMEQVAQIDSKDMDHSVWQALALRCAHHLADPEVRGIVITHGTDTLEETAWFLHQVLVADKPVVLTCAMRPATALTPDGPQNLLDAVALARTEGVCGVLMVAAGEVHGAERVQKVHPYRVNAFNSGDAGPWGFMEEGKLRRTAHFGSNGTDVQVQYASNAIESIVSVLHWPRVEIVLSHGGAGGAVVDALLLQAAGSADGEGRLRGLVVACTGNGTLHYALEAALLRAQAAGVRVLRATRCSEGRVLPKLGDAFPDSGGLSPVKARITLMLDLMATDAASALGR